MSMILSGEVRGVALLKNLSSDFDKYHQDSIAEAARVGYEWLIDESEGDLNTPIDTGDLISTVGTPYSNQRSVTFRIAGILTDPHSGRPGRPYGFAQEYGWHDRDDGWHPGHHMVETAALLASGAYVEFMTEWDLGKTFTPQPTTYRSLRYG